MLEHFSPGRTRAEPARGWACGVSKMHTWQLSELAETACRSQKKRCRMEKREEK